MNSPVTEITKIPLTNLGTTMSSSINVLPLYLQLLFDTLTLIPCMDLVGQKPVT